MKATFINGHLKVPSPPLNPDSDNVLSLILSRKDVVSRLTWLLCLAIRSKVPDMASILPSLVVLFD